MLIRSLLLDTRHSVQQSTHTHTHTHTHTLETSSWSLLTDMCWSACGNSFFLMKLSAIIKSREVSCLQLPALCSDRCNETESVQVPTEQLINTHRGLIHEINYVFVSVLSLVVPLSFTQGVCLCVCVRLLVCVCVCVSETWWIVDVCYGSHGVFVCVCVFG